MQQQPVLAEQSAAAVPAACARRAPDLLRPQHPGVDRIVVLDPPRGRPRSSRSSTSRPRSAVGGDRRLKLAIRIDRHRAAAAAEGLRVERHMLEQPVARTIMRLLRRAGAVDRIACRRAAGAIVLGWRRRRGGVQARHRLAQGVAELFGIRRLVVDHVMVTAVGRPLGDHDAAAVGDEQIAVGLRA